jgi:hypothetical protein
MFVPIPGKSSIVATLTWGNEYSMIFESEMSSIEVSLAIKVDFTGVTIAVAELASDWGCDIDRLKAGLCPEIDQPNVAIEPSKNLVNLAVKGKFIWGSISLG